MQKPEAKRMTAALKYGSLPKLQCRDSPIRRARFPWREVGARGEEVGRCIHGGWRGMGPSDCTRNVGTTSGRALSQQGLAVTCEDRATDGETRGSRRDGVWRMSPYERRRRGNALSGDLDGRPCASNTHAGQRGSGHSVASFAPTCPDTEPEPRAWGLRSEGRRPTSGRRGVGEPALELRRRKEGPLPINGVQSRGQNRTREIRPSGIAGGPEETWPKVELGTHPATERAGVVTLDLRVCAPQIYPDIRTHGSIGRGPETGPRR